MTLHGPAHPDEYRVAVGRYGDRHYHDPLPADDRWPATDEHWPSVSTIKKASAKDWSWVTLERAAHYLADRRHELDGLNAAEIHTRLLDVNKAGLNRAAARGSAIHHVAEQIYAGQEIMEDLLEPEARQYLSALHRFFDECQPEFIASEIVCISRGDSDGRGYGGTCDAVIAIDGRRYVVDWKTRRAGKHGAYIEEAMQIAAYRYCQYVVVDGNGGQAVRQTFPDVNGGLIVSIAPEGYRLYPVDLGQAFESFRVLLDWWHAKKADVIGKPKKLGGGSATVGDRQSVDRHVGGGGRLDGVRGDLDVPGHSHQQPRPGADDSEGLRDLDGQRAFLTPPALPDEGAPVDADTMAALLAKLTPLKGLLGYSELLRRWAVDAAAAGGDIRLVVNGAPVLTVRRFELGRLLLGFGRWCEAAAKPSTNGPVVDSGKADEAMRAIVALAVGLGLQEAMPTGAHLASLTVDELATAALIAGDLVDGTRKLGRKAGRAVIREVA